MRRAGLLGVPVRETNEVTWPELVAVWETHLDYLGGRFGVTRELDDGVVAQAILYPFMTAVNSVLMAGSAVKWVLGFRARD